jgi:hypothetical protein
MTKGRFNRAEAWVGRDATQTGPCGPGRTRGRGSRPGRVSGGGPGPAGAGPTAGHPDGSAQRAQAARAAATRKWGPAAFPDHVEWREWDRDLHPGDIILTYFRGRKDWGGSMADLVRAVMRTITDEDHHGQGVRRGPAGGLRMRRAHRLLAGLLATGALLTATAGCAQSVDPIERLGRKAAQKVSRPHPTPRPGPAAEPEPLQGVRGDQGAAGSMVVGSCGRPGRPQEPGPSRSSPPLRHWRPIRPGPSGGAGAGTGCERR